MEKKGVKVEFLFSTAPTLTPRSNQSINPFGCSRGEKLVEINMAKGPIFFSTAKFVYENVTYSSHDFYGNFQKNASIVSSNFYQFSGVFIKAQFEANTRCRLSQTLPALTWPNGVKGQVEGSVVFVDTEELLENSCYGFSAVVQQLDDYATVLEGSQFPKLKVALFSSIGPQEVEFGGPYEPYSGRIHTPDNIQLAMVSKSVGEMLVQKTVGPSPFVATITQEPGAWNIVDTSYRLALHRWSLFVLTFFALIYAFYQLINLFYQEGWQFDTRIILYIAALIVLISSLISLGIRGQSKGIQILTYVSWLIGFSAYSTVQFKWGQIISKLFPNILFKSSFFFIIFVMINYVVVTVLNIVCTMVKFEKLEVAREYINAVYLPLLITLQAMLFFYYALMYKRGMKAFPMTSRTRVSLEKLALLLIFAVIGFTFEAISQFLSNGKLVSSVVGNVLILTFNTMSQLALFSPVFAILSIRGTEDTATYAAILQRNRNGSLSSTPRNISTSQSNKSEHMNHSQSLAHMHTSSHTHSFSLNKPVTMNKYDLGVFKQPADALTSSKSVSISLEHLNSPRFSRIDDISTIITPLNPPPPRRREKSRSQTSISELLTESGLDSPNDGPEPNDMEFRRVSFLENDSDSPSDYNNPKSSKR
ncbi:hypothetical protein K493DRAFT_356428 [Basidiobolus meristosporus CBS 931.73]|uniref:Uncharacterized protein n=1 Tax=Basidiobolus meristosporus CBS 931.73 TaxID=1314790 RepID=A0A1Y1XYD8_9FUNG|nr:hypothetical protein K493DRAFT_356428 [Basidiobolus meristosporus CBS 931.73]|eukprot:ORX90751.1 hypothetical protein K493DRAFT_356428 [Basidiobolus meristosporus CBS 931.73]